MIIETKIPQNKELRPDKLAKLCEKIKDADSNKKKKHESLIKEFKEYDSSK